ncbi:uncharacterized protein LOC127869583 [Dreissena polymorpha]|uniref:uncharacterized protein LOC127869583 n=1 Tax=Dreissena polymorpha TaxID=45954 RepID=UPI00226422E8|nr:uncharacterized protein LOC127869583 [Dreissena polymorpha]
MSEDIMYELYYLTAFSNTYTVVGNYDVKWNVENGWYNKSGSYNVIVQTEVEDFKAWLALDDIYAAIGDRPKMNVSVTASNLVSSVTQTIIVDVFYKPNNINFNVASIPGNTTSHSVFDVEFMSSADLPMKAVNIIIDYSHGTKDFQTIYLSNTTVLPLSYNYTHLFDMPGLYMVSACIRNRVGDYNQSINMSVWDSLIPLDFVIVNGTGKYITNLTASFEFMGVPNFGFKYKIDYGDGTNTSNTSDSIMYIHYGLTTFRHVYRAAGVYTLRWTAYNGHAPYNRSGNIPILVQNRVPTDGYTLEPDNKKYPWLNLQTMSIPINITLNSSVHIPTNATCMFDPDDGNTSVHGLVYDSRVFNHSHMYRDEGIFNASFNCSNEVSWYIYKYSIEVVKYNASFLSVIFEHLVPLNVSDSVTVYFHIENGGFALIPLGVYLDWDFGVSATERLLYDRTTFNHTYSARGDYTVKVYVTSTSTNTSKALSYPLRLGIMHFEYNTTISYINTRGSGIWYKMYGHLGVQTMFNITYNATYYGHCNAVNYSGCVVEFLCPQWGYSLVTATAINGTFIEFDNVNVTCDNPIIDLATDIVTYLTIPNGTINARLRISATALYLPVLFCVFNMGDPIMRNNYGFVQNVTFLKPFIFENFIYYGTGVHTITINCWNLINSTKFTQRIQVVNTDFSISGVFDRYYSQMESPMYISSMIGTGIFSRSEIMTNSRTKAHYNSWLLNESNWEQPPNRQELLFTRGSLLPEKKHLIKLEIGFYEEIENKLTEPTYVQLVMPPPHASIVGGSRRWANRGTVTVDAVSESYDPVTLAYGSLLMFSWDCKALDADSFEEAYSKPAKSICSLSNVSTGIVFLNTTTAPGLHFYNVTVSVDNKRGGVSNFTQTIGVSSVSVNPLEIRCTINCLSKVAVTSKLQLVPRLSNNIYCPTSLNWTLQEYNNRIFIPKGLDGFPATGTKNRSITIGAHKLDPGKRYLVTLTIMADGLTYGPAYYEFVTNLPPKEGHCNVFPYTGNIQETDPISLDNSSKAEPKELDFLSSHQKFNMTCLGWKDEGWTASNFTTDQPLFYYFYVRYSGVETEKQILYFDPGQTSNIVTFQTGDPGHAYNATAVIRVSDIFGDYAEVKYKLKASLKKYIFLMQ